MFPPQHCLTLPRLPSLPARAPRTPSLTLPRRAHSRLQLCTARPPAWNPLLSVFLVACSLTFPKSLLQCHLLKEEAPPPRPVRHRLSQRLSNVGNQSHHLGTRVKSGRCRPTLLRRCDWDCKMTHPLGKTVWHCPEKFIPTSHAAQSFHV